jgi:signal transduction histidine kinase
MPTCHFVNFDFTIRGGESPYSVTASYRQRNAEGTFTLDATQPVWQRYLELLGNSPGSAVIAEAGSLLFRDLIQGDVRDLWVSARTDYEQKRVDGLRIRLALQPPAVAALPWESLYDPDRNVAFAASSQTPLVRVENLLRYLEPSHPLRVTLPIRVLLAAPEDPSGQINAQGEIEQVTQILETIGRAKAQVTLLDGRFSIIDLRREIERVQADIVHIVTHGQPEGILLWQQDESALVSANSLRMALERTPSVKLVFLNACLAGRGSEIPFTSVGAQLLQAGAPAVIAMQFNIRDDAATAFARSLYEELITGSCPGAIDAAVGNARSNLYLFNSNDFSYGAPILWLNAEDGVIFDLGERPEQIDGAAPIDPRLLEEIQQWLDEQMKLDLSALSPDLEVIRMERERAARDLRDGLFQLRFMIGASPEKAAQAADKLDQIREQQAKLERFSRIVASSQKSGESAQA